MNPDRKDLLMPTYFISHGGGPWPWIKDRMPGDLSHLEASLKALPLELGIPPRAILAISGHWEETIPTVMTSEHPPMVYDYSGFPEFTYHIQYPAPGSPAIAARVQALLQQHAIQANTDPHRGYDHGVFAPFFVAYPDADVPILQLSIVRGYDPALHLAVGRALAPLRKEGVLIVGSGLSYHNLREFGPRAAATSKAFDTWLTDTLCNATPDQRTQRLIEWENAPAARASHPREDHLIPLMVAVGAAEQEPGQRVYHEDNFMGGVAASSYRFGATPEKKS
jgi:aromatic ring-opening dioxygenase catalytic subunit (LigB family)